MMMGMIGPSSAVSAPAFAGPGDSQTFVVWGSVSRGYSAAVAATGTKKAFRVVDGSNANGLDILVKTTGLTDVAALTTWIGSFGTAHVTTLYDQVGTNDWVQATNSQMPTITLSAINGLPAMTFASASSQYLENSSVLTQAQTFTFQGVAQRTSGSGAQEFMSADSAETDLYFPSAGTAGVYAGSGPLTDTATDAVFHVLQGTFAGGSSTLNVDGRTQIAGSAGTDGITVKKIQIGRFVSNILFLNGYVAEAGMYAGAYNSSVQSNARTAYGL